jgi:hypothetical protein
MKILPLILLFPLVATLPAFSQTPSETGALPVTGWTVIGDKSKAYGPKEESGAILFAGSGFGDKGKTMAAVFPKTTLDDGQALELSAKVTFTGVSGQGNFRFGIFKRRSLDHPRGWLGYCAYAGIDKHFPKGGLYGSQPENDANFDASTAKLLGEATGAFRNIKDGSYNITMRLSKVSAGIECVATMSPVDDPSKPVMEYTVMDDAPTTLQFDSLGFSTHQLLSTDSFELKDVVLQVTSSAK